MTEAERRTWLKQVSLLGEATNILKKDNDEYFITKYVDEHEEEIYNAYCETFPERVNSDFEFEDIDDEWIIEFAKGRI